jgi:DNA-binding NtrC family response regulator
VAGGNESLLVVDDEPGLAETASAILSRLGYRVHTQSCPQQALETISRNPAGIDLLITDMTMPVMTGLALAQAAWRVKPGLPVVVCTGYSDQLDEKSALAMGITAFLMKPVHARELGAAVRQALDQTRSPAQRA